MVVRFSLVFLAVSLLCTFLTWGRNEPSHEEETGPHEESRFSWIAAQGGVPGLILHITMHVVIGGITASPSRRLNIVLASGLAALLLDSDHFGWLFSLPTLSRANHSLGFMVIIAGVMGLLAQKGVLGRDTPPLLIAVVAGAVIPGHIVVDVMLTEPGVPLWAPLSIRAMELNPISVLAFLVVPILLVSAATLQNGSNRFALHSVAGRWKDLFR